MRPEDALQIAVTDYLRRALTPASWFCAIPNGAFLYGGKQDRARQGAKLKAMGNRNGAPDMFVIDNGRFLGIELKCGANKQQPSQIDAETALIAAGARYGVCKSLDDVEAFLTGHSVPLRVRLS